MLDAAPAREPALDPDRVGVLGGSYGGYLTSLLIGHTDRFAAACSERAVNNLESEEWSSDDAGAFRVELGVTHLDARGVPAALADQLCPLHPPRTSAVRRHIRA